MPPPPPSPLKMPNPRTGVDDGAFFKAARRTTIAMVFSLERRREGTATGRKERHLPSSKWVVLLLLEVLPRFIKIDTNESYL